MMDLYELTRALVRRGMPEHPRVQWWDNLHCWAGDYTGWVYEVDEEGCPIPPNDDDLRDLITMHALRWFKGRVERHWNGDFRATKFKDDTFCIGDTLLEAILAATEHLEPKS